ncbi:MAG: hypothetical protein AAF726_18405 [Planctomycetota bacterium]
MQRRSLSISSILAIATALPSPAQTVSTTTVDATPTGQAARYAGVYHTPSGTWTRPSRTVAGVGSQVVYDNTAVTGYFSTLTAPGGFAPGSFVIDEGGLPGTTNGNSFPGTPDRDGYLVEGFQIAYCDFGTAVSSSWTIRFYDSYVPCTSDLTPEVTVDLDGLPANGCWIVDIDLSGGEEFCLGADGGEADPDWSDDPDRDSFGWDHSYTGPSSVAGLLIAGDPALTDPGWMPGDIPTAGNGTYYGASGGGTGYLTQDLFRIEGSSNGLDGCYQFGNGYQMGGPYGSFHLRLSADPAPCSSEAVALGTTYCTSAPNSTGEVGRLRVLGSSLAGLDLTRLVADQLVPNTAGYFIVSENPGLVVNPGGMPGTLCLGGDIGRFRVPGQPIGIDASGEISMRTGEGTWSLASLPRSSSNYAALPGTTNYFQVWHRDTSMGVPISNFSDAMSVLWR